MVTLKDIVVDPTIQVREVESHTVSEYAAAMRAGSQFPPLIIEKGTNRLVCGNHRYYAYKVVKDPSEQVPCEYQKFADEAEIIRTAAKDNATHGRPLDTWDRKRITLRLQQLGDSLPEIAALLSVPVYKVENWAGMSVVVVGGKGKSQLKHREPMKHGLEHLAGQEIPEEQYHEHAKRDQGVPAANQARMLTRWILNGWIPDDSNTKAAMAELHTALTTYIKEKK